MLLPTLSSPRLDLLVRALVAAASGASLALLVAPYDLAFLHWIVYLPMLAVLDPDRPRRNALFGLLFGIFSVGTIFRWIADTIALFSNIPALGALGVLFLFALAFGGPPHALLWPLVHPLRKRLGLGWVLAAPAALVLIEYVSMYVLLFPYNQGVSQYRTPVVFQLVSVTGIWGMSFLLFGVNAVLAEALFRRKEGRPWPVPALSVMVMAVSAVLIFGVGRHGDIQARLATAPVIRIAQLQSPMPMTDRLMTRPRTTLQEWIGRTRPIVPGSVDFVIWPEGAALYSLDEPKVKEIFATLAKEGQFEMIVGSGARSQVPGTDGKPTGIKAFNSIYHVAADGSVRARYDKMVPLPFGEYLPLKDVAPWLFGWITGPGDFQAGDHPVTFETEHGRVMSPICYEAILPYVCRRWEDPDLILTVTQDAWFGDTAAPHQHSMLAQIRAVELGVPMYRAAYTGASVAVNVDGTFHDETEPFTEVDRIIGLHQLKVWTPYAAFGDWFVGLCALGLVGAGLASRR